MKVAQRAHRYLQTGLPAEAERVCEEFLDAGSEHPDILQLLAMARHQQGDLEGAAQAMQRAVSLKPQDAMLRFNLAVILQGKGDVAAAAEVYRQSLAIKRTDAALINLAVCERYTGGSDAAEALYAEVLRNDPGNTTAIEGLIHSALEGGRGDAAAAYLESHGMNLPRATQHRFISQLHRLRGDLAAAIERLNDTADDPQTSRQLGRLLLEAGRLDEAIAHYRIASRRHPDDPELLNGLGVALTKCGDVLAARTVFAQASTTFSGHANSRFNHAASLSKSRKPEELRTALKEIDAALQLQPANAAAWDCKAKIQTKLGDGASAFGCARRAVELDPQEAEFHLTLAEALYAAGEASEAIQTLRAANSALPNSAPVQRQLAIHLLRSNQDVDEARAALESALELDPSDQRSIAHYGVALAMSGDPERAKAYIGLDRHVYPFELQPPRGFGTMAEFNRQLAQDIVTHSRMSWEPVGLAARGGGLTDDLLADRTPAILGFEGLLRDAIESLRDRLTPTADDPFLANFPASYRLELWATLTEAGGSIDTHIHEESWLSGAYYVQLPDPAKGEESDPQAGWIEFGRPHEEIPYPEDGPVRLIQPQAGNLLLFPSFLFHRTIPHASSQRRMSISFDLIPTDGKS